MASAALTIATRKHKLFKTAKKVKLETDTGNPNIFILGESGTGKTFLCEAITLENPDTSFVYLGRRETISDLQHARKFSAIQPENFFEHNPESDGTDTAREAYLTVFDAAVEKAVDTKSVLIIEELSLYLWADAKHVEWSVQRLAREGITVIFTSQVIPDGKQFSSLAVGTVLMPGRGVGASEIDKLESIIKETAGHESSNDVKHRSQVVQKYARGREIGALTMVTGRKIVGGLKVPPVG